MALPIITAICREIFAQTPTLHQEAALALGATRWEMIRMTVFPYGRSGIVSAIMLGLGRALGETMAVAMVLSATGVVTFNLISSVNPSTIAANIALKFPEATGHRRQRADLQRPGAVPRHVRRQLPRPRHRRPWRGEGSPLMTTTPLRDRRATSGLPAAGQRRSCPRWAPRWSPSSPPRSARCWCSLLGWGVVGGVVLAVVVFLVALPGWSRPSRAAARPPTGW